jgi:hypothetical protein
MSEYKVQSLVFDNSKFNEQSAQEWLKKNKYKFKGFDIKKDTLRARQLNPAYTKKLGYTDFKRFSVLK